MEKKMNLPKEYVVAAYDTDDEKTITYIDENYDWTYKLENAWRMDRDKAIKVAGQISKNNDNLPMHLLRIEITDIAEITNTLR